MGLSVSPEPGVRVGDREVDTLRHRRRHRLHLALHSGSDPRNSAALSSTKIPTQRASIAQASLWMVLGGWASIQIFFGLAVTPAVLRHVPSPQAGELVAAVLTVLNWAGVAAGLALALIGRRLARGRVSTWLPLALAAGCVVSQLVVSPAIARVRLSDPDNATNPEAALQFRNLHGWSVGLYGFSVAGVVALSMWHGRCDRHEGNSPPT